MRLTLISFLLLTSCLCAQTPCGAARPEFTPKGISIFSVEQEGYLGDAIAEMMEHQLRIYPQSKLTAPLEQIVARLNAQLAPNRYQFHLSLIELPQATAFAVAGGRIYVSRRLIQFAESEDELAGVLAHEMGHIVARQSAVEMSRLFRDVLKVNAVGGRDDVFQKFNQLIDAAKRARGSLKRENTEQIEADRISLEIAWRAGYDPQAFPRILDRLTDNQGATGNMWTDLFGLTRPESKRLRELLKAIETLPSSCREAIPTIAMDFKGWQGQVATLGRQGLAASAAPEPTLRLSPKLRPEVTNIKFSPDGRLLLAQDESGIHILNRDPFQFVFRIPALEAGAAQFDVASKRVLIPASDGRLESVTLETKKRETLWEASGNENCSLMLPSPDGRFIACFSGVAAQDVRLIDVGARQEVAHHTWLLSLEGLLNALLRGREYRAAKGEFVPDGSAFVLSSQYTNPCCSPWAFDLNRRAELQVGKPLKDIVAGYFAFLSPDQIAVMNPRDFKESGVFAWPGGKWLDKFPIPNFPLERVTKGATVLLKPYRDYAVASLGIEDRTLYQVGRSPAIDRYDDVSAAERSSGEMALYPGRRSTPFATVPLPDEGELGSLRAAALSPGFEWLAISTRSRGLVWDLATGKAKAVDPFDGSSITSDGIWTTTIEGREPLPGGNGNRIYKQGAGIDLRQGKVGQTVRFRDTTPEVRQRFHDSYAVTLASEASRQNKTALEVSHVASLKPLWSKDLESLPDLYVGEAVVLAFDLTDKTADRMLKANPSLKKRVDAIGRGNSPSLLDVLDIATGESLGQIVYEAGAAGRARSVRLAGPTLFIEDRNFRTLAYSLKTGDRVGQQFGRILAINAARGLVAVQNQAGRITVLDEAMHPLAGFDLQANVIFAGFDQPGKRLLALTGAQDVFVEDLP